MRQTGVIGVIVLATIGLSVVSAKFVTKASGQQIRLAANAESVEAARTRGMAMPSSRTRLDDRQSPSLALLTEPGAPLQMAFPETKGNASASSEAPRNDSGRRLALVIGNANYSDDDAPLSQPVNDARALADELRGRGFDVEFGEDLTKQGMESAIARFETKIAPGSTALFFFSGYGMQSSRQSFLIPIESEIWRSEDVQRRAISLEPLIAEMNRRGARLKLVILDASRRNPFERRLRGFSSGLAPMAGPADTLVLYGVTPGNVANDSEGENSLLMTELLKQIRSPGLTVEDVFNRTRMSVARVSKGEQVPGVFSSLVDHFNFAQSAQPSRHSAR